MTSPKLPDSYSPPTAWTDPATLAAWMAGRQYADKKPLPACDPERLNEPAQRKEVLLSTYAEVSAGWRALTDVRFKLLGLLPAASIAVVITLFSSGRAPTSMPGRERTAIAILGLLFTLALLIYERRNTDLYDDLVGRGRQLEAELGIHTGMFRGRPKSRGIVRHDVAIWAVYSLSALAWLAAALQPWL